MRLDQYLVICGLAESRTLAQKLIDQGVVIVNGKQMTKSSFPVLPESHPHIEVTARPTYVSRGGEKLAHALSQFSVPPLGIVADIGASTGGFTDCLLQHGAQFVYAIDVGHDQLHPSLRTNQRVRSLEGVNIRHFNLSTLDPLPTFVVVDVSFISLHFVFESLRLAAYKGPVIALIKPQFELQPQDLDKHGVVRYPEQHLTALLHVQAAAHIEGYHLTQIIPSPIRGEKSGNIEFLGYFKVDESASQLPRRDLEECVKIAHEEL